MLSLIEFAMNLGVPARFAKAAVFAVLGLLLVAALWGGKCAYDKSVIKDHEAKIVERAKPATDKAADERARDTIAQAKNEEDAHNAVHSVPDAVPAGPSHALACQRLHKLGRHPASCG
jgi:hypothetical protein